MSEVSYLRNKLGEWYSLLFQQQWSTLTGGSLLGLLSILVFAWSRPWGIVGGIRNWADWFLFSLGIYSARPENPLVYSSSIIDIGLLLGCFASALMAKEFALRVPPRIEAFKGLGGGVLMGVGSAFAMGCNVGAFYSPLINLSASGLTMMLGLMAGAYLGLRYLLWELENIPSAASSTAKTQSREKSFEWKTLQPYLGLLVFIGLGIVFHFYSELAYTESGGLLLFGAAFGVVLQRCRFCFVRAFRDPFMTGEAEVAKGVAVSIAIGTLGVAILKWNGFRSESMYVIPTFGWGSLVGGLLFGIGMVIAGGCGSGTLWRVAEGHLKLWLALFAFALSNSLVSRLLQISGLRNHLGLSVFLPDFLGWNATILGLSFIMLLWVLLLSWNEETNRFTIGL